ncbi:MAG: helix-turn-helix domain-containing protein [Eubacteriaceae bacterium]
MLDNCRNIYKTARETAGLTQEKASELLFISVRSIADYESGRTIPGDDVVCRMIENYKSKILAYMHLKYSSDVGYKYLPDIISNDFSTSVIRFQKEYQDISTVHKDMIEVACDGMVDDNEVHKWEKVKKEISEMAGAAMALMFAK